VRPHRHVAHLGRHRVESRVPTKGGPAGVEREAGRRALQRVASLPLRPLAGVLGPVHGHSRGHVLPAEHRRDSSRERACQLASGMLEGELQRQRGHAVGSARVQVHQRRGHLELGISPLPHGACRRRGQTAPLGRHGRFESGDALVD